MKLGKIFDMVGAKVLSEVETNKNTSNQHEFNGVGQFKKVLGYERKKIESTFIITGEYEEETLIYDGFLSWYDSREDNPKRSEWRLYFSGNLVVENALSGDILFICKLKSKDKMLVIIAKEDSTASQQLLWLFNLGQNQLERFHINEFRDVSEKELDFSSRIILENIGVEFIESDKSMISEVVEKFGKGFPSTKVFSKFAYTLVKNDIDMREDPDGAILKLYETEDIMFKTLEKHFLEKKLEDGFKDTEEFLSYSLSVQQRRYSRAGLAFENHLENIFLSNEIKFDRGVFTEHRKKPDFLFPGKKFYDEQSFDEQYLTMLGVKTTCKDRWRQVLSEADRIKRKHLSTLQPSISVQQTDEMKANNLTLVIPEELRSTYKESQYESIISLNEFITHIKEKQEKIS